MNANKDQALRDLVLRTLKEWHRTKAAGLAFEELLHVLGVPRVRLGQTLSELRDGGLIVRTKDRRFEPATELGGPMLVRRLTAEELDRVRRGEPSSGAPIACAGLPEAVLCLGQLPTPPHQEPTTGEAAAVATVADRQRRGRPRAFSDAQLKAALAAGKTYHDAAELLRVSLTTITRRAAALGFPVHRQIAPERVTLLDPEANTPRRRGAPRKVSDQRLVAVLESTGWNQRQTAWLLGMSPGSVNRRVRALRAATARRASG